MHQQISKKILVYLFIFFSVGTFNNKKITEFDFTDINNFKIKGLTEFESNQLSQQLNFIKHSNIFFLDKKEILKILHSNKAFEKFSIFKNYPSNLIIDIKRTKFLALTKKDNSNYYIGSNGNLIKTKDIQTDIPFVFGEIAIEEFLKLKKIIDKSGFDYNDIKNLYYFKSKRWDIETNDNLIIKLPIENLETSFRILLQIYQEEEFSGFGIIDLRQNNQIILNG